MPMNNEELREYANSNEAWSRRTRIEINKRQEAEKFLAKNGASQSLIDDTLSHHDSIIKRLHDPFVLPDPDNNIDGNNDGEMTRQDVMDRRERARQRDIEEDAPDPRR